MSPESQSPQDAEPGVVEPEIVGPEIVDLPAAIRTDLERLERRTAEQVLAEFEIRRDLSTKVLTAAIALTRPKDWVLMGETCYLQEYGCARIKALLGFRLPLGVPPKITRQELKGEGFAYVCEGWAGSSSLGISDYFIGARASNEKFFDKFDEDGNRLPVPATDVMKAAQTNWLARAVTGLAGLRGLTPDDLKEYGIDPGKIRAVKFQAGAKGGGAGGTAPNFGNEEWRGKEWKDLPPEAIKFYRAAAERSLKDESKSRYHVSDKKRLDAINHEIHRRQGIAKDEIAKKEKADGGE